MTTRIARLSRMALLTGLLASACRRPDATVSQPAELSGRWARFLPDQTWGDTIEFRTDGSVVEVAHAAGPDSLRWSVVRSRAGDEALCLGVPPKPTCRPYRFEGDTLIIGRLPAQTYYRRADAR